MPKKTIVKKSKKSRVSKKDKVEKGVIVPSSAPPPAIPQGFTPVHSDVKEIRKHLDRLTRSPFREELAKVLGHAPTADAIENYANKYPDRWGQLVAILSRLSGYTPELKVEGTIHHRVEALSDYQILKKIKELEHELAEKGLDYGSKVPTIDDNTDVHTVTAVNNKDALDEG